MNPVFTSGGLRVRWCDGGVFLLYGGVGLLLDAPVGIVDALGADLARVQAVVLTGGRIRTVGGLIPLLAALEPHRLAELPLTVHLLLGEERGALMAETWVQGWPDRYPVTLDAEIPGGSFEVGPFVVETHPVRTGEPRWRDGGVEVGVGVAVRVRVAGVTVVWIPGAAPAAGLRRLCAGADLAVVEYGVRPWPKTEARWRLSLTDGLRVAGDAGTVWLVGDDGRFGAHDDD